jgi:hypothetical protein
MWNENGGESVEAQVDSAMAAARRKMAVAVECLLLPVNWANEDSLHRLHSGRYRLFITKASRLGARVLFPDCLYTSVL